MTPHSIPSFGAVVISGLLLWPTALPAQTVGSLVMAGDRKFDCDSIASAENPSRRWLSYPGGRLCINPASARGFVMTSLDPELSLNIGGFLGTGVLRLEKVVTVRLLDPGSQSAEAGCSTERSATWYPYKIAFQAGFSSKAVLSGYDYFLDADSTLVRVLELKGASGKELSLVGTVKGSGGASWDEKNGMILVRDAGYLYALRIMELEGGGRSAKPLPVTPVIGRDSWQLRIPVTKDAMAIGVGFGFAAATEGEAMAVARAKGALARPVNRSLAAAKSVMDDYLRRVPAPKQWGVDGIDTCGVTAVQHRQAYYMAWSFVVQSVMNVFPENPGYPYPQMSLGKSSLWAEGEKSSPATCGWESFMALQWFAFLKPDLAWKAYEGIMSRVDADGKLGGESLPSRKAQTAWILYQRQPDRAKLKAVYPAIKRYLLWREKNPRWIYGGNNATDEKDIEFVVSWLVDVDYAIRIADALGLKEDSAVWKGKIGPMQENLRSWFFSDPAKLHQFYFADKKLYYTKDRSSDRPIMTLTALCLKGLPEEMVSRLKALFLEIHNPEKANDGFAYSKYPDNNFDAYGLIDHGLPEAKSFVQVFVRDSIRGGEFAETLELDSKGELKAAGVKPSVFTCLNLIEFTWMLNQVRYESGKPVAFKFPTHNCSPEDDPIPGK